MTTKIEWVKNPDGTSGYTINPVKGLCPMACPYCYARRMYKRFKWNPEIRFERLRFEMPDKPSRFFVGSTIELFGEWVKPEWLQEIFGVVSCHPQHTFIFLTKQPQNLIKWSPFPRNAWVGVTATNADMCIRAGYCLTKIDAKVKFLSLEPLLDWQHGKPSFIATMLQSWGINWLIIGACTGMGDDLWELGHGYSELTLCSDREHDKLRRNVWTLQPKIEWVREIAEAADKAGIPVFLKDNLKPLLVSQGLQENMFWKDKRNAGGFEELHLELRQELPV